MCVTCNKFCSKTCYTVGGVAEDDDTYVEKAVFVPFTHSRKEERQETMFARLTHLVRAFQKKVRRKKFLLRIRIFLGRG